MDPDQANAPGALDWSRSIRIWSNGWEWEESGSGLGQPDPDMYIKGLTPVSFHFGAIFLFLLFSSPPFSHLMNPNPSFQDPTQKQVIYGSKASSSCSNHESMAGTYMHELNHRRSELLLAESVRFWSVFLVRIFFLRVFICWFVGLQRWINVVNLGILKFFRKS